MVIHAILPTGSEFLSNNTIGIVNKVAVSHQVTQQTSIAYNVAYINTNNGTDNYTYSLAFVKGINKRVGFYIEPYGELASLKHYIANVDAGITYLLTNQLQLDFSLGTGLNNQMNYMATGLSWLIEKE